MSITSHIYLLKIFLMKIFKSQKILIINTVSLIMLHIRFLDLIHLLTESLCHFTNISLFPSPLSKVWYLIGWYNLHNNINKLEFLNLQRTFTSVKKVYILISMLYTFIFFNFYFKIFSNHSIRHFGSIPVSNIWKYIFCIVLKDSQSMIIKSFIIHEYMSYDTQCRSSHPRL